MPSEKPPTLRFAASVSPTMLEHLVGSAASADAGLRCEHAQVVAPGAAGVEARGLQRRADRACSGCGDSAYAGRRSSRGPRSGETRPSSIRRVVVLPAPFGPRNPVTTPGRTSKVRSSTARTVPKVLVRESIEIIAAHGNECPAPVDH